MKGDLRMDKQYPAMYEQLQGMVGKFRKDQPATMTGFFELHKSAVADGSVSARVKELIALGIAVAVRCDGCISYHVHDALRAGATRDEIGETVGVAVLMGGGPALMYAVEAMEAVDQFQAAQSL
jgi:AhpD family alkylhydroperoxidase